jgi:hypothetical protein
VCFGKDEKTDTNTSCEKFSSKSESIGLFSLGWKGTLIVFSSNTCNPALSLFTRALLLYNVCIWSRSFFS